MLLKVCQKKSSTVSGQIYSHIRQAILLGLWGALCCQFGFLFDDFLGAQSLSLSSSLQAQIELTRRRVCPPKSQSQPSLRRPTFPTELSIVEVKLRSCRCNYRVTEKIIPLELSPGRRVISEPISIILKQNILKVPTTLGIRIDPCSVRKMPTLLEVA